MITENGNNYFRFNFKKVNNLGKYIKVFAMYLRDLASPILEPLRKYCRILGSPFKSYNKKWPVLFKRHMRFLAKCKAEGEVPKRAILLTEQITRVSPRIPHSESLEILIKQHKKYTNRKVSTEDIGKMADFVL